MDLGKTSRLGIHFRQSSIGAAARTMDRTKRRPERNVYIIELLYLQDALVEVIANQTFLVQQFIQSIDDRFSTRIHDLITKKKITP